MAEELSQASEIQYVWVCIFHIPRAPGFGGPLCDVDLNECASHPCLNRGTCVDGADLYQCFCPDGMWYPQNIRRIVAFTLDCLNLLFTSCLRNTCVWFDINVLGKASHIGLLFREALCTNVSNALD